MKLVCAALHPDPRRRPNPCGGPLAAPPVGLELEYQGIVTRMPEKQDAYFYLPCLNCRAVNVYRVKEFKASAA